MYAKVFNQIFDSSIADDYRLRHFFMDLLVLADINGCVDMTPTAIAARTRMPLDEVTAMISKLEQPDPESRTPDHDGRRIARLDEHRTWGWFIINYDRFRKTASEEQRRERTAARTRAYKARKAEQNSKGDAVVTLGDAGDAMQRQRQMQSKESKESLPSEVLSSSKEWKPDSRTKEEQLAAKRTPKGYPSQVEFDAYLDSETIWLPNHRPDLYRELCETKWCVWKDQLNKWERIQDWRKFVIGLDVKIEDSTTQGNR